MKRAAKFDPDFGTATQAVAALRRGVISSRELTAHVFARITPIDIAARMADITGGFVAPPTLRAEGGRKEA